MVIAMFMALMITIIGTGYDRSKEIAGLRQQIKTLTEKLFAKDSVAFDPTKISFILHRDGTITLE